nr:hypothetical protein GCSOEBMH_GCSOEBMH_CDS_0053 [uncultured phage]
MRRSGRNHFPFSEHVIVCCRVSPGVLEFL